MIYELLHHTTPWHHIMTFFSITFLLIIFIRNVPGVIALLICMAIGAESLQLLVPRAFSFELMDIIWNIVGGLSGILAGAPFAIMFHKSIERARLQKRLKKGV